MSINIKDKNGNGISVHDVMGAMKKKDGDSGNVLTGAESFVDLKRIPTGIFGFDYATGGGFPCGKISVVYGLESSGKSIITYCAIRQAQLQDPDSYQVILDVEQAFDANWAKHFIIDMDRVIIVTEDTAEAYIDRGEALLMAKEVNLLVTDSLAMLTPENELGSSAEKASVGGAANLITKMLRKYNTRLAQLKLIGQFPAVVCVNQIRHKIGFVMGDPETQSGGNAIRFMASLVVRFSGKNEKDAGNSAVAEWKLTKITIKKWKIPILCTKLEYHMRLRPEIDQSTGEIIRDVGYVNDIKETMHMLKTLGMFQKGEKKGYTLRLDPELFGKKMEMYDKVSDLTDKMLDPKNELWFTKLKSYVIDVSKALSGVG